MEGGRKGEEGGEEGEGKDKTGKEGRSLKPCLMGTM